MRRLPLLALALLATMMLAAQDFVGVITDNHAGVPMMNVQPASIVSSPWKWDVHPLGAEFSAFNTNVIESFRAVASGNPFPFIKNSEDFLINADLMLPSFLWRINDRMAVGLETKLRGVVYTRASDSELLELLVESFDDAELVGLTLSNEIVSGRGHMWWEIGGVFAYKLLDQAEHSLSAGVTLRYLGGLAAGVIDASNLSFTYEENQRLTQLSGTVQFLYNQNLNTLSGGGEENFRLFSDPGFGASLGAEYSWSPKADGYSLKLGVALLDLGRIVIEPTPESTQYVADTIQVDLDEVFEAETLEEVSEQLGQIFREGRIEDPNFSLNMPTKLALQADYRIASSIYYVNFSAYLALRNNLDDVRNAAFFSSYFLTPRVEKPTWSIQLPLVYSKPLGFNAGIGFRFGPVYFSSQNIIGALINGQGAKRFDLALGFRFGGRYL